jgi:Ca2+-binding RTX toxin-like protein
MKRTILALGAAVGALALPAAASATVTTTNTDGNLVVTATGGDDINVSCDIMGLHTNNGLFGSCSSLKSISLNGGDGDTTITAGTVGGVWVDELDGKVVVRGGAGNDTIDATALAETIEGGDGNDTINSGPGDVTGSYDHVIYPGPGADTITASGTTHDRITFEGSGVQLLDNGGPGKGKLRTIAADEWDTFTGINVVELQGTGGDDYLEAWLYSASTLTIDGHAGKDEIYGPLNTNAIVIAHGGEGDDTIAGGGHGEDLFGDAGNDTIDGGGGDDWIRPGAGNDTVSGGTGDFDQVTAADLGAETTLTATTLTVASGTDTIAGDIEHVSLFVPSQDSSGNHVDASGWPRTLTVSTEAGDDIVVGGSGRNTLTGGEGNDQVTGGASFDSLGGGPGNDIVMGGGSSDTLSGGLGDDFLVGGAGEDDLAGGPGADELRTLDGVTDDTIDCGSELDILRGDALDIKKAVACETATDTIPPDPTRADPTPGDPSPPDPTPGGQQPLPGEPPKPPADTLAPKVTLGKAALSKKGVYTIKLTCPVGEVSCSGGAVLASVRKIGKKKVTFGKAGFTAAGGKAATLKIKLSKASLKLLKKHKKIAARLTVDVRDAAGNSAKATARTTLRLVPSRRPAR